MTALEGWSPAGLPELSPGHAKAPVHSEGLAISKLPGDHAKATPHPSLIVPLPSLGTGLLRGVTKVEGVPQGGAWVRVLYRPAKGTLSDGAVVADVISANDGTWEVTNLNLSLRYDVVCRMAGRKDLVIPSVAPVPMRMAVSGGFTATPGYWDGSWQSRLLGKFVVTGGRPPYSSTISAGTLPLGVTLRVNGDLVFAEGGWDPLEAYSYPITVTFTDADGYFTSLTVQISGDGHPAGNAGVAARYWRITVAATQANSSDHTIGDIELRAEPGGANLPVTVGGTASASSAAYYPASRAFDGMLLRSTNAWVTGEGSQPWVQWDFGLNNSQTIRECSVINSQTTNEQELNQHPLNYLVSFSDDTVVWTPAGKMLGAPRGSTASSTVEISSSFTYGGYRHYRLYIAANNGDAYCAISELELLDAAGYDVSTGISSSATASSAYAGDVASKAFDGSTSPWITASGAIFPQWIAIDLGLKSQLSSFAMVGQNGLPARTPRDFVLQGSNDGTLWTEVKAVTNQTAWADSERRVFTIDLP